MFTLLALSIEGSLFSKGSRFHNPNPFSQMFAFFLSVIGACPDSVGVLSSLFSSPRISALGVYSVPVVVLKVPLALLDREGRRAPDRALPRRIGRLHL